MLSQQAVINNKNHNKQLIAPFHQNQMLNLFNLSHSLVNK